MESYDSELEAVFQEIASHDPAGTRTARLLRYTLDQLYDGQRTGLVKLIPSIPVEINMQREFLFDDGETLDFNMNGTEVDCKYSQKLARWMIPLEARGRSFSDCGLTTRNRSGRWASFGRKSATSDQAKTATGKHH